MNATICELFEILEGFYLMEYVGVKLDRVN
jgi:hypothetical protein